MCVELVELSAPTNSISQLTERLQKLTNLANHARTELAKPEPVAPTDEELSRRFRAWWYDEGSGLPPLPSMDHEEHTRRISEIAWANGAYVARYCYDCSRPEVD
jgi:hypothetical protein